MKKQLLRGWMVLALLLAVAPLHAAQTETAILAGGCFWCTESDFDKVPGVISTTSGYIGGDKKGATYEAVTTGSTGHIESVQVIFDPAQVSYAQLLDKFWRSIDPTTANAQFCDRGYQYSSAIFYMNDEQKRLAEASKEALKKSKPFKEPIVTEIVVATTFYPAEEYHQNFHVRNAKRYKYYRWSCGRDQRLEELWGKK